jgi:hypothetical protein
MNQWQHGVFVENGNGKLFNHVEKKIRAQLYVLGNHDGHIHVANPNRTLR